MLMYYKPHLYAAQKAKHPAKTHLLQVLLACVSLGEFE